MSTSIKHLINLLLKDDLEHLLIFLCYVVLLFHSARYFSSVQLSRQVVFDSPCDPMDRSNAQACSSQTPSAYSVSFYGVGDAIQPFHSVIPFTTDVQSSHNYGLSNESSFSIKWPVYWS